MVFLFYARKGVNNINIKKLLIGAAAGAIMFGSLAVGVFAVGTNGSFETGVPVPGGAITLTAGDSTSITDWTVATGDVDYIDGFWQAANGTRSIDLNGFNPGSVSQNFTTVNGATYNVTFHMSGNPGNCSQYPNGVCSPDLKTLRVSATGAVPHDFDYDTSIKTNSFLDMKWESNTYSFVATTTSTTLTFASQIAGAFGPALDNVSITETLPATVKVTIDKYINGAMATVTSANSLAFPMVATWNATNIGAGTGNYDLDADGFNGNPTPYQAITENMSSGADYSTDEVTGGSVVGTNCSSGQPYALAGYTTGDTLAQAEAEQRH